MKISVYVVLIIALGLLVYANSLGGKFIMDDVCLIEDNAYIKNWSNILDIFTKNIVKDTLKTYLFYRPAQLVTYMADYSIWKLNTAGYHITNIGLHILTALAAFCLINLLFGDRFLSFLTGLFFVVHPIHTEAVSYISGRADILAAFFMLMCFIFYTLGHKSKNKIFYIFVLLSYAAALLSRENSLILPAILLLYHYIFKKGFKIVLFFSPVILAGLYILARCMLLKHLLPQPEVANTIWQRMPGFFIAITDYTRLLLLPLNLHMLYGNKLFNWTDPKALSGLLMFISLVIYALRAKKSNGLISFSILWFFITLLPLSNLYPIDAYMAEHWLYLPSMGFFLILAKLLSSLYRKRHFRSISVIFIAGLLSFYSYLTVKQNNYWKDPITFYERTLKYSPDSPGMFNNLGVAYQKAGNPEKAIAAYKKTIEINPKYTDAYNNLGVAYCSIGREEDAIGMFKKAIETDWSNSDAHHNLGRAYSLQGRYEDAIQSFKNAIAINPRHVKAHRDLGLAYYKVGKTEEAVIHSNKAKELAIY